MLSPSRSPSRGSRMLEAADGASLRTFNTLLFLCTISLILKSSGEELISYLQPIRALMGDDVILPCRLNNATDVHSKTVVWTKPDLDPVFIHVHQSGRLVHQSQHPSYRYRTTLFEDQLVNGNVSLKLFTVKISDAGTYVCSIQSMGTEASVELLVGAASTPVIDSADFDGVRLVLRCHSSGWRPQPELSWLDSEGHVLPAGPTENLTGPGGLYSVNSTVTVDNRGSSRFTCRVQQKDINQTRETHIQVSGAASTPVIDSADFDGVRLVLRCHSSGWYPQPELSWLDSEGHVLPAGPTETLRGSGGLYSVNSTVTVDNRGSSRFTCRVQQKDINQTRETHIQVSADVITPSSLIGLWVACGVGALLILIIVYILVACCIRRYRKAETRNQTQETTDQRPQTTDQAHETRDQRPDTRDHRPEARDQDQCRVNPYALQAEWKKETGEDHPMLNGGNSTET